MRRCCNHTWRLLACVLVVLMSVGCGNPDQGSPPNEPYSLTTTMRDVGYSSTIRTPRLCIDYGEPLEFSYAGEVQGVYGRPLTMTTLSTHIESYYLQPHNIHISFPEMEHQLPLRLDVGDSFGPFEGVWDQANYPVPDPQGLYQNALIIFDVTMHDDTGQTYRDVDVLHVGIDFYTYTDAGGAPITVPCSEMQ